MYQLRTPLVGFKKVTTLDFLKKVTASTLRDMICIAVLSPTSMHMHIICIRTIFIHTYSCLSKESWKT